MNYSIRNVLSTFILSLVFNTSIAIANEENMTTEVSETNVKVQELFKLYNNGEGHAFYQQLTDSPGEKPSKEMVVMYLKEREKNIGKMVRNKFLFSQVAAPNLLYLFYRSTYEHTTLTEYFCFSRESSSKTLKLAINHLDIEKEMRNEGERDERVNQAEIIVKTFRDLYNQKEFEQFYQGLSIDLSKGAPSRDKFLFMMNEQDNRLGKYISAKLLFSRSKPNGVVLTYLTQYEKYAVVELWGFVRNSPEDLFKLIVYDSF